MEESENSPESPHLGESVYQALLHFSHSPGRGWIWYEKCNTHRIGWYMVATQEHSWAVTDNFQIWVEQKTEPFSWTSMRIAACCNDALLLV